MKDSNVVVKKVLKWEGLERGRLHLWKVSKEALIINSLKNKRNLDVTDCCPICENEEEIVVHIVRDYSRLRLVWIAHADGILPQVTFFEENLITWVSSNLMSTNQRRGMSCDTNQHQHTQ